MLAPLAWALLCLLFSLWSAFGAEHAIGEGTTSRVEILEAKHDAAKARQEAAFHMQQRAELMHELATIKGRAAAAEEAELKRKLEEAKKQDEKKKEAAPAAQ